VEDMNKNMEENTVEEAAEAVAEETVTDEVSEEEIEVLADEETETEETEAEEKETLKDKLSARKLKKELAKSEEKVAELTDRYQRLMAEFENARKRTAKETTKMYDMGAKDMLEKLLPVIDNFERGMATLTEEEKELPYVQGIDKIYKQFLSVLEACHVEPMNAEGKEFNPDFHNAVMHIEDENLGENVVAEELLKGYMYKDMVLRFSMVKVAN